MKIQFVNSAERLEHTTKGYVNRRDFLSMMAATTASVYSRRALAARSLQGFRTQADRFLLPVPPANPFYAWPRTLVAFPAAGDRELSIESHTLRCVETQVILPFQITRSGDPQGGRSILFFADLPSAQTRTYELLDKRASSDKSAGQAIAITKEQDRLAINTGAIRVRIPDSQNLQADVPGPILQVSRGGAWKGLSKFTVEGCRFTRIETVQVEGGPLRSIHRITYHSEAGANYVATVECVAGMDYVRLHENMEALPADSFGAFDFAWTGCDFSYRQGPNHPYNFPRHPLGNYTMYPWEKIAPAHMDTQFGVSPGLSPTGRVPFSLRLFEPWSDASAACFANFWSDASSDAAAIFIDHMEDWEDHEYSIWHSSPRLAVEFVYTAPALHFLWKIGRGSRSTCLCFYDHAHDIHVMKTLEERSKGIPGNGAVFHSGLFPTSYALELQNWQGVLNLNKVKNWVLDYPKDARLPQPIFASIPFKDTDEFYRTVSRSDFVSQLALSGVRQNNGFGPVSSRQILESWVPAYEVFRSQLNFDERRNIDAILLLLGYVHAGEDYMPMQRMLAGHPNFLSDVKSTPCGIAFLFPDHPAADLWADEFEAYLRMNTRYHTRPAVDAWGACGGRWTENIGTYVWAFLRPASRAAFLLKCRDGYERLCGPRLANLGDWLVNSLSAPFDGESPETLKRIEQESARDEGARRHYWGIVSPSAGPRRVYPPIGAHAERRKPPRSLWYLGNSLRNFSPLTAEYLMWAARPTDQDMEATADQEDTYGVMYSQVDNKGTNPHLRSTKYTGYGITLRASVDTPRELSIHLQQIDDGPNYRWGTAGEGVCGVIYFFANGKAYSHNGSEDAGDRIDQDTDFCTNFGVWKNGAFRSIGQNVLTSPLFDLSVAQFAQVVPRYGPNAYSWPEYVSRSILLAGDDYFLIYDQVFNPEVAHRFSWFVRKGDDFPNIILLSSNPRTEVDLFTEIETETTSGKWAEGMGNSLAFITHKNGIRAEHASFGARVFSAGGVDLVFLGNDHIDFQEGDKAFQGSSGIIRNHKEWTEIALFHGSRISAGGVTISTGSADLGISATLSRDGAIRGFYFVQSTAGIEIALPQRLTNPILYIDGAKVRGATADGQLSVNLPAGRHQWEITSEQPIPLAPQIERTEYTNGGAVIHGFPVASSTDYVLEISADNAQTWTQVTSAFEPIFTLSGLICGKKYHVRLRARNSAHTSPADLEYPLYITQDPPPPPDGLHVELAPGEAEVSWGQVLGVTEYRLYRRTSEREQFVVAYAGRSMHWTDSDASTVAPAASPLDTAENGNNISRVIEYYITSVNQIGESRPSRRGSTDPASWKNWNPTSREPFRRTVERTEGNLPNDRNGRYYPD